MAGGPITQAGAIAQAPGAVAATFNAGANTITLANPGNDFTGAVGLTTTGANNATLKDTNALVLGASSVGGNLDVTAKGNITETGALLVTGTSTFTVDTTPAPMCCCRRTPTISAAPSRSRRRMAPRSMTSACATTA
jgi:hypothetical protein